MAVASSSCDNNNNNDGRVSNESSKKRKGLVRDDAYWERRRKNNDAAKRSRDSRRKKVFNFGKILYFLQGGRQKFLPETQILKDHFFQEKNEILKIFFSYYILKI